MAGKNTTSPALQKSLDVRKGVISSTKVTNKSCIHHFTAVSNTAAVSTGVYLEESTQRTYPFRTESGHTLGDENPVCAHSVVDSPASLLIEDNSLNITTEVPVRGAFRTGPNTGGTFETTDYKVNGHAVFPGNIVEPLDGTWRSSKNEHDALSLDNVAKKAVDNHLEVDTVQCHSDAHCCVTSRKQ